MTNTRGVSEVEPYPNVCGADIESKWMCPKVMSCERTKSQWIKESKNIEGVNNRSRTSLISGRSLRSRASRTRSGTRIQSKRWTENLKLWKVRSRITFEKSRKRSEDCSKEIIKEEGKERSTEFEEERERDHENPKESNNHGLGTDCQCTTWRERGSKSGPGEISAIAGQLIARLDSEGHRQSTEWFCGGSIGLCDFPHGFMILANDVSNPPAVHLIVDNNFMRTEQVAPFYIAGGKDDTFNR